MKRLLAFAVVLSVGIGIVIGRSFERGLVEARAAGGQGGGNALPACEDINGDGSSDVSDAIFFLNWRFQGGPAPTCPATNGGPSGLPDTGQTKCYDVAGAEIPCDSTTCRGQDGAYATGCASGEGRFVDNMDGTVTDSCTGLMWQKETADTNGDGQVNGSDALAWCAALAYCENLTFAGHDDWRLPNVRELQSIVDYGRFGPAIDPVFGALSSFYWSSTSFAAIPGYAWLVHFHVGDVSLNVKDPFFYVRGVRRGP